MPSDWIFPRPRSEGNNETCGISTYARYVISTLARPAEHHCLHAVGYARYKFALTTRLLTDMSATMHYCMPRPSLVPFLLLHHLNYLALRNSELNEDVKGIMDDVEVHTLHGL
ncbi:hypothetical protein ElyMa_001781700 [Elysia marginata]|uniref:Uncharacterized protein n=1 Tax=Elysia marginata TaxID=1093978 RepID=A0AAV4EE70_9GAST|nr:hypothetical protein ElyMa_001781700 [Elysia marginata]